MGQKAFRSAWNDVVIPCKIEDLHSYSELNYSEIADALEEEKRLDETCGTL